MLLNAEKCQGYSFYHFWVIKGKPIRGKTTLPNPLPRLELKYKTMILLCVDFFVLLSYTNLVSPNDYSTVTTIMTEEAFLKFRIKKTTTDEGRNYLLEEIEYNDLMIKKHQKTCKYLNYVEHLLILASKLTGCISISAFVSLVAVLVGITSSAVGLKACFKNFKFWIKKVRYYWSSNFWGFTQLIY